MAESEVEARRGGWGFGLGLLCRSLLIITSDQILMKVVFLMWMIYTMLLNWKSIARNLTRLRSPDWIKIKIIKYLRNL